VRDYCSRFGDSNAINGKLQQVPLGLTLGVRDMQGNVIFQKTDPTYSANPPAIGSLRTPDDLQFYQTTYQDRERISTNSYSYSAPMLHQYSPPGVVSYQSISAAFGTGGFADEPSLLEGKFDPVSKELLICAVHHSMNCKPKLELGINFEHIRAKVCETAKKISDQALPPNPTTNTL
jgi:hypothetical protein